MYIDIAVIVVLIIGVLIGIKRGFWKGLLSILAIILTAVAVFLLVDFFANYLGGLPFFQKIGERIRSAVFSKDFAMADIFKTPEGAVTVVYNGAVVDFTEAVKKLKVPSFLHQAIVSQVSTTPSKLGDVIAIVLTKYLLKGISAIIIGLCVSLFLAIINIFAGKLPVNLKKADKPLGAIWGILFSFAAVSIIFFVMHYFDAFGLLEKIGPEMERSKIAKPWYDFDIVYKIINIIKIKR